MAMGKRKGGQQERLWVPTQSLAQAPGHPFYEALNKVLADSGFDDYVEGLCKPFYADTMGRPSLAPGVYFRMLLIGYFERIDSERGIAWRCADSLALRSFLGYAIDESPPDHSTLSRTRRLLDLATHAAVFTWVLVGRRRSLGNKLTCLCVFMVNPIIEEMPWHAPVDPPPPSH